MEWGIQKTYHHHFPYLLNIPATFLIIGYLFSSTYILPFANPTFAPKEDGSGFVSPELLHIKLPPHSRLDLSLFVILKLLFKNKIKVGTLEQPMDAEKQTQNHGKIWEARPYGKPTTTITSFALHSFSPSIYLFI